MSRLQTEAILLRSVDFGESDRIVHLLTPQSGRLAAMAKGARRSVKRFPGTLDIGNHLQIQVVGRRRGLAYLEQGLLISPFPGLRTNLLRFGLACYLLELLDRLAPEGGGEPEMRKLFDFALAALRAVETTRTSASLRTTLELRTLDALGLRPEFRRCVRCGDEAPERAEPAGALRQLDFHIPDGGVVCRSCAERAARSGPLAAHAAALGSGPSRLPGSRPVGLETLRALEGALSLDLNALGRLELSETALAEASDLVHRFQRFHVGVELRSARFLNEVLAQSSGGAKSSGRALGSRDSSRPGGSPRTPRSS